MNKKRKYIVCYFIYAFLWFFLHTLCGRFADDAGPFSSFTWESYISGKAAWSSRFFISLFGTPLKRTSMHLWMCLDTVVVTITTLMLDLLFNKDRVVRKTILIMGIFCLFPFSTMSGAGWITTTMVYLWIITAAMYDVLIAEKVREGKKVSICAYIIAGAAFICAMDVETGAVAMFVIFSGYSILQILDGNRKKNIYVYILAAVSFARIIFDVAWKGNTIRYASEIRSWFPDYAMLDLLDKVVLGFSASAYTVYIVYWLPVLFLTFLVCMIVFEEHKDLFTRMISIIAIGIAGLYPLSSFLTGYYEELHTIFLEYDTKYGLVSFSNYYKPDGYLILFLWGTGLLCIAYSLICIRKSVKSVFIWLAYLFAGFASKFIMGFSPTVAASGSRTASWLFFAILLCLTGVYTEWETKNLKLKYAAAYSIMLAGGVSFLNSLLFASKL